MVTKQLIYKYYVSIILMAAAIFVLLQSPLSPFANKIPNIDSSIFIYSAKEILKGKLIYKDVFDHKGPMIFLINIVGLTLLGGNMLGIWLIELVLLFISSQYLYKVVRLWTEPPVAIITVVFLLLSITPLLEGGNMNEEYVLTPMAISLYLFLRFILNGRIFKFSEVFTISSCFVLVFLFRPNLVSLWISFTIVVIFLLVREGKYKDMLKYIVWAIASIGLTVLPFLFYALKTGILSDAIFSFWTFNVAYSNISLGEIIFRAYNSLEHVGKTNIAIIMLSYAWYYLLNIRNTENKVIHIALILSFLVTMLISCGLGKGFAHYAIAYVPVVAVPAALCFSVIHRYSKSILFTVGIVVILSYQALTMHAFLIDYAYVDKPYITKLVNLIKVTTSEDDKIAVVGCDSKLFFMSERQSISKYVCLNTDLHVPVYGNMILNSFCSDLLNQKPKLVIVETRTSVIGCISDILEKHYDRKVKSSEGLLQIYMLK